MFDFRPNSIFRFNILVVFAFTTMALVIIGNTVSTMFKDREIWTAIKNRYIQDSIVLQPERGRILDDKGGLIVSSLPYYRLRIDFKYINKDNPEDAKKVNEMRDSLWKADMNEVCEGLHNIFPSESAESFKKRLTRGFEKKERYLRLYRGKISYTQYNRLMQLPIFRMGSKYSGLFVEKDQNFVKDKKKLANRVKTDRKNIFGDIGLSTFGIVRETVKDDELAMELNGLEKKYNGYLEGTPGMGRKETNRKGNSITKVNVAPKAGMDIQTTIDTDMLDICENALKKVLLEKSLPAGWAILMETKTGDIKAIVNLTKSTGINGNAIYLETTDNIPNNPTPNHALCRMMEPGSIFKTIAVTAMLADGKVTVQDSVKAYASKACAFNGKVIRDEMYRDNGTGKYSMGEVLKYSSNIGMVQYIKKAYETCPEEYTNTLKRFGLTDNYKLIESEVTPYITTPDSKRWSKQSLNSMSYGYAVQMTGINMLVFYNTIANGGVQMQPRIVKAVLKDGEIVEEFPTKVINDSLFSKKTADEVTEMLINVVEGKGKDGRYDGTGKRARSGMMKVAGKTGTADLINPKNGKYDGFGKMMSFCGFFPADNPQYTLLVQTIYEAAQDNREEKTKLGGGSTSAIVFKEIADKVMSKKLRGNVETAKESDNPALPAVKKGNLDNAGTVLAGMGMGGGESVTGWGKMSRDKDNGYSCSHNEPRTDIVPNVTGMGARDAVFLLQNCKLEVVLNGYGTVISQSIHPGSIAREGDVITLTLRP
ncbi:MAG: transpeptidase family protein [Bacteroidaceae bacterium]|nr:transpeptidase family protein [Bacteroidaceae bacterium]